MPHVGCQKFLFCRKMEIRATKNKRLALKEKNCFTVVNQMYLLKVFEWAGEMQPPSSSFYYYNKDRDMIDTYTNTISMAAVEIAGNDLPLVMTAQVCYILDCLTTWLSPSNEQHFLIVGPHGSAKRYLQ